MQLLEDVFQGYHATIASGARVPPGNTSSDLAALRDGLPAYFAKVLRQLGRDPDDFHIYGGVGPRNFNFAKIPWVAICDGRVSSGAQYGYFVVLLFKEDLSGCYLSLNQGYTQYLEAFGTNTLALKQITRTADACAYFLNPGDQYVSGAIDLAATLPMGRGYEKGAIVSGYYPRSSSAPTDLQPGLAALLAMYDSLIDRVGPDILAFSPPISEDEFQAAVSASAETDIQEPTPGPKKPPKMQSAATGSRYRRDPNVAALAIKRAGFSCEVDRQHISFRSQRTGLNFVEAHHLFPMGAQGKFQVSLDVPENVVALCPNCHRLLHHGLRSQKRSVLKSLWKSRSSALVARGISEPVAELLNCYRKDLGDGD
jgi:5-methylcytosine-specific restriction protein A